MIIILQPSVNTWQKELSRGTEPPCNVKISLIISWTLGRVLVRKL